MRMLARVLHTLAGNPAPPTFRGNPGGERLIRRSGMVERLLRSAFECAYQGSAKNNYDLKTAIARAKEAEAYRGVRALLLFPP